MRYVVLCVQVLLNHAVSGGAEGHADQERCCTQPQASQLHGASVGDSGRGVHEESAVYAGSVAGCASVLPGCGCVGVALLGVPEMTDTQRLVRSVVVQYRVVLGTGIRAGLHCTSTMFMCVCWREGGC
jgi:hypothetical protein